MKNASQKLGKLFKTQRDTSASKEMPQNQFQYQLFKSYMNQNDIESFLMSLYAYLPKIQIELPDFFFVIYLMWLVVFKAKGMTIQSEMVYSKYVLPLCLEYPNQMRQMKSKPFFSYLKNDKAVIKDQAKFKAIVDQYVNLVLLMLIYLGENKDDAMPHQRKTIKEKINNEVLSMNKLEGELAALISIDNPSLISTQTANDEQENQHFVNDIFSTVQHEDIFYPFSNLNSPLKTKTTKLDTALEDNSTMNSSECSSISSPYANDPYSNYSILSKAVLKNSSNDQQNKIKYENPLLKDFCTKDLRKEEVDKKIFRMFRACLKEFMSQKPEFFRTFDKEFWSDFVTQKLLPPMKYYDKNQIVQFKSFNTNYFIWLFSKKGTTKLYNAFVNSQGEKFLKAWGDSSHLKILKEPETINKLRNYLLHVPCIYSPSWVEDGEYIVPICTCTDYRFEFDKILYEEEGQKASQSTNTLELKHPDFDANHYLSLEKEEDCFQKQIEDNTKELSKVNTKESIDNFDDKPINCRLDVNYAYSAQDYNPQAVSKVNDDDTFCSESNFSFKV